MKNSLTKFYAIKLLLTALVGLLSAVAAYLVGTVVSPFDSIFYRVITSGIPMIFFMYFMYTVASRIKLPEGGVMSGKYLFRFALSEASVYAIFLLPLTVIALVNPGFIEKTGIVQYFYAPHSLFIHLTGSSILNLAVMTAIFGIVSASAHYMASKRPAPAAVETVTESTDKSESESEANHCKDGDSIASDDIDNGE